MLYNCFPVTPQNAILLFPVIAPKSYLIVSGFRPKMLSNFLGSATKCYLIVSRNHPKMQSNQCPVPPKNSLYFWSRGFLNPQDLWIHVRSFVRPTLSQKSTHQIFLIFLMKPWFHKCKKSVIFAFSSKIQNWPFFCQKW